MIKKIIPLILFLLLAKMQLYAQKFNISGGLYGSYMSSMGGNLNSYNQNTYFGSNSGIDSINRTRSQYDTSNIDRLTGAFVGMDVKAIFLDYYMLRIGANYGMSVMGGKGRTVYTPDGGLNYYNLKCEYSLKQYDFPFTLGLSIPFWKDSRISVSCGTSFSRATYENKFESDPANTNDPFASSNSIKGKFTGWAFPLVVLIQGDLFIAPEVALTSTISYYKGRTKVIKDSSDSDGNIDFASIDFTGYRFSLGISYNFYNM
jgi:hypothetical protein